MHEGLFLGAHGRNGDALIMTEEGVIKGGPRKKKKGRKEGFDKMRGAPRKMRPKKPEDLDAPVRRGINQVK